MATGIIGSTTTYTGDEIPGLKGRRVRVFGVMRGALRPDVNVDDYFVTNEVALALLGGVTPLDRIDVAQLKGVNRAIRRLDQEGSPGRASELRHDALPGGPPHVAPAESSSDVSASMPRELFFQLSRSPAGQNSVRSE